MKQLKWTYPSKVGPIYLVASAEGLTGIFWKDPPLEEAKTLDDGSPEACHLLEAMHQLSDYFSGRRKEFDLPLIADGTDFQKSVWNQLKKVPYGKVVSYSDIAKRIKNQKAVRAVGSANGKNPFSIVVPCHRVIAADGTLGGYAGGLEVKRKLLEIENS